VELNVVNGSALDLSETVFAKDFNEALIHQAVVTYMAGGRAGTKANKSRSEVSGGGIKPWRQKGTGRARAGTIRSPLWRSGGVTFAAKTRDYSKKLNKKMYKGAMRSILSELVRSERLIVVEDFSMEAPKTKELLAKVNEIAGGQDVLIITDTAENVLLSARNLYRCEVLGSTALNPVSLVAHEKVVITKAALENVQEWLS